MDLIARVELLRRHASNCLYCPNPPDTNEHVLAEAVGGRLIAPLLCSKHNNVISIVADAICTVAR
jgi:hypothetical protein